MASFENGDQKTVAQTLGLEMLEYTGSCRPDPVRMSTPNVKNVVVIGAGVVGLTTAVKIQEHGGYSVTIVADTFPSDPKSIRYTSLWAGAHHVSHAADDLKQRKLDQDTFEVMWALSEPGGEAAGCFMRITQTDYFYDGRNTYMDWMPDFLPLPESSLIPGARTGVSFTTLTIDPPTYLNYLLSRFLAKGGAIVRGAVQHVSQVVEGGAHVFARGRATPTLVDAVVVCAGLGARTLGGVEDKDVFPIRGQGVLLRAPWFKLGRTASHLQQGLWTYTVPRRSGDVMLGGTKMENDWYPVARPATTEDILARCLALCPELAPPKIRAERAPTVEDLLPLIVEEGCGFRPARKGGIRLGVEWIDRSDSKAKILMVFNYGHGGGGFQSSWGSASVAFKLLEEAFAR